mmetsp:Transcript_14799/g.24234  ORF Transcript_14799/g.24234 Transcript_14799/m.24234 type:complete len:239 (-) Transcript_14799:358-1074(-)
MLSASMQSSKKAILGLSRRAFADLAPYTSSPPKLGLAAVIARKRLVRDEFRDMIQNTEALEMGMHRITVGDVLAKKEEGQRGAWLWIDVHASALSAVKEMTRSNVGALLVMKKDVLDTNNDGVVDGQELASGKWDDAVAGVVSERDYLKKIVIKHLDDSRVSVGDIMTGKKHITVASTDTPVLEAMRIMTEGRFRHMPVVNHDRTMAGMLYIGDVTRMVLAEHHKEVHRLRDFVSGGY